MTRSRGPRVLRGFAAASLATFVALLSHVAAGGGLPGPVGVVVPWLLAVLVSIALAGRRLAVWRLSVSVVASQVLFHVLFVLGSGPTDEAAPLGHSHDLRGLALETFGVAQSDVEMWLAHVIAALATITLLHRGELVVHTLLRAGAELRVVFTTRFVGVAGGYRDHRGAARFTHTAPPDRLRPLGWDPRSETRRGPPRVIASSRPTIAAC